MSFDYSTIGKTSAYIANEQAEAAKAATTNNALNQEDFLKLLTTQLQAQDPSSPVDNNQMVATMSQLSIVENLTTIGSNMSDIVDTVSSSSALTATTLVGRSVLVDSSSAYFDGSNPVVAKINAGDGASNISVTVMDANNSVIAEYAANAGSGSLDFSWDGMDGETGEKLASGTYKITAQGTQDGQVVTLPVSVFATVGSVTLGTNTSNTSLNLIGYGSVPLSEVSDISI
ncbi:MAG: flagellar hook assembly protein FlgD [Succinivibrionaceae bacterium]|nr:flagellar hook assembly protein FlgD [Succinivibrionaceae bacterium]